MSDGDVEITAVRCHAAVGSKGKKKKKKDKVSKDEKKAKKKKDKKDKKERKRKKREADALAAAAVEASRQCSAVVEPVQCLISSSSSSGSCQEIGGPSPPRRGRPEAGHNHRRSADVESAFLRAVARGDVAVAARLIQSASVDVNCVSGDAAEAALHLCARFGLRHVTQRLLDLLLCSADIDVNKANLHGDTPLHFAVRSGAAGLAEQLLEAGADPTITNADGVSVDADGSLQKLLADLSCRRQERERHYQQRLREEEFADSLRSAAEADDMDSGGYGFYRRRDRHEAEDSDESVHWMDKIAQEYEDKQRKSARTAQQQQQRQQRQQQEQRRRKPHPSAGRGENPFQRLFDHELGASSKKQRREEPASNSERTSRPAAPPREDSRMRQQEKRQQLHREQELARRRAEDEARWKAFEGRLAAAKPGRLRAAEVPWPSGADENPVHVSDVTPRALALAAVREALRRWHPDKLLARLSKACQTSAAKPIAQPCQNDSTGAGDPPGGDSVAGCKGRLRLPPEEHAAIAERTKALAQKLNAMKDRLMSLERARRAEGAL
eukprot:TRINITY_DN29426_c0_g1_i5.p1 TRINITY_DN29426_c0_g1~~TRINITY_DN29426_c0_g1_i5.p1  ORF type:complete len:584 (+),score=160.99 TRINITY_DN29426_c0_g1_i5:93-1754(+)